VVLVSVLLRRAGESEEVTTDDIVKIATPVLGGSVLGGIVTAWVTRKGAKDDSQLRLINAMQAQLDKLWEKQALMEETSFKKTREHSECLEKIAVLMVSQAEMKASQLLFEAILRVKEKHDDAGDKGQRTEPAAGEGKRGGVGAGAGST